MKTQMIDLSKYVFYKESQHYIVYLEKNPSSERMRQMIVKYKDNNHMIQISANDYLYKLLFEPEKFKTEHMKDLFQRSK